MSNGWLCHLLENWTAEPQGLCLFHQLQALPDRELTATCRPSASLIVHCLWKHPATGFCKSFWAGPPRFWPAAKVWLVLARSCFWAKTLALKLSLNRKIKCLLEATGAKFYGTWLIWYKTSCWFLNRDMFVQAWMRSLLLFTRLNCFLRLLAVFFFFGRFVLLLSQPH